MDLGIPGLEKAERVGVGGFATVYRAFQPKFDRVVAVKVLHGDLDNDSRARFERECRTLGSLSAHPHIVTVHDSGVSALGNAYLVLEYCPGGTLARRLTLEGALPPGEVVAIGVKVAGALAAAHGQGVLHRDVKPENILVTAYGEPALGDFGIARVAGGWQTSSGVITLSVAHAAPEVLAGEPGGPPADQWALASTLWQLLAGTAPFVRPTDQTVAPVISRVLTQPPPPLEGVPAAVVAVLERALTKDPSGRWSCMATFAEALQATVAGSTTSASAPAASTTGDLHSVPREDDEFVEWWTDGLWASVDESSQG